MKLTTLAALAVAATSATAAWAQAPQFVDQRTGKVWTPDIVSQDDQPQTATAYPDLAFDPSTQTEMIPGVIQQHPRARLISHVPMTAGRDVPLVTLDLGSLQALPGQHWLAILYLSNHTKRTVDAVLGCRFTNQGRKVEHTRVIVPPAGPGERLGMAIRGPRTDFFVDQAQCEVLSPI